MPPKRDCGSGCAGFPRAILNAEYDHLLSNIGQLTVANTGKLPPMAERIYILNAERDGEEGLIVTFSDGTTAAFIVEELLDLRPYREPVQEQDS